MKKAIISGVIATILGGVALIGFERIILSEDTTLSSENGSDNAMESIQYSPIEVDLTGSNNDLILSASTSLTSAQSVNIFGSNLDREISIPIGQTVNLTINGSNNEIKIDEAIFPQTSISESGANNKVLKSK